MLINTIGYLLPVAMAVALTPFPIVAIVLMLSTSRPMATGSAFATGWVVALAAVTAVFFVFVGEVDERISITGDAWVQIAVGLALLAAAVRKWRTRPRRGEAAPTPRWIASLQGIGPLKALLIGAGLGGGNPKNLALALAAGSSIADNALTGTRAVIAVLVFTALGSSTVLGALLARLVGGQAAARSLDSIKTFMLQNNNLIMMILFLLIGFVVLGNGLASLGN